MTSSERRRCEKNKSSISRASSYAEIEEFWDKHDLSDFWNKTRKVKLEVFLEPEATYYPIEKDLSEKIQSEARKQGVSSDTLVNLWLEQKIKEQRSTRGGRRLSAKNL
jgi:CopG antitoxin of type II toxin-antitoxin system